MAYQPNHSVHLANTKIIEINGQRIADVSVNVRLQLIPSPTVIIETDALPRQVFGNKKFDIVLAGGLRFKAVLRSYTIGKNSGTLMPAHQPVTVIDSKLPLRTVDFCILNFPPVYGNQEKWIDDGISQRAIPHMRIEVSGWCVEMTGVSNIQTVEKMLNETQGIDFTYRGQIKRIDGNDFEVIEVEKLLNGLRVFLSFARGAWCSFVSVKGKEENDHVSWIRWGAHYVTPWKSNNVSWLIPVGGDNTLSD